MTRLESPHLKCIHNDRPHDGPTRNITLRGLFGVVIWIALWSLIITAAVSPDVQRRQIRTAALQRQHQWLEGYVGDRHSPRVICNKCGLTWGTGAGATLNDRCSKELR
jgi:hypothetical protein